MRYEKKSRMRIRFSGLMPSVSNMSTEPQRTHRLVLFTSFSKPPFLSIFCSGSPTPILSASCRRFSRLGRISRSRITRALCPAPPRSGHLTTSPGPFHPFQFTSLHSSFYGAWARYEMTSMQRLKRRYGTGRGRRSTKDRLLWPLAVKWGGGNNCDLPPSFLSQNIKRRCRRVV